VVARGPATLKLTADSGIIREIFMRRTLLRDHTRDWKRYRIDTRVICTVQLSSEIVYRLNASYKDAIYITRNV